MVAPLPVEEEEAAEPWAPPAVEAPVEPAVGVPPPVEEADAADVPEAPPELEVAADADPVDPAWPPSVAAPCALQPTARPIAATLASSR